jgi:hypothetical protein
MRFLQTAHAQLPGSGVQEALRCPAAYQCADAVVFQYDPVYELEPTYVTSDQIHTSKTVRSPLISIVKLSLTQTCRHTRLHLKRSSPKSQRWSPGIKVPLFHSHQYIPNLDS